MSLLGIASSSLFSYLTQHAQSNGQQFKQEFQQLGQDLQSGNLTAAQSDLAALRQNAPQFSGASSSGSASTTASSGAVSLAQEFKQLAQDLQSGNLSGAQQAYSTLQQDLLEFTQGSGSTSASPLPATASSGSLSVNA
jgi:thioredoxin-like negative regulator of GroEL